MSLDKKFWRIGEAKNPDNWGGFRAPESPDRLRGVYSDDREWVCDCTDEMTARGIITAHNDFFAQKVQP